MHNQRLLYWMLLLAILITVGSAAAQDMENVTVIGGDEAQLRQIITYLAYGGPLGEEVTVTVGQLPETLPFTLPVAEDSTIIGSVDRSSYSNIEIWLHSPQSIQAVIDYYTEQFAEAGWDTSKTGNFGGPSGGFSATTESTAGFCGDDISLMIHAQEQDAVDTRITIYIDFDRNFPASFCSTDAPEAMIADVFRLLPSLVPPEGVTMRESKGGGGGGGWGPVPATATSSSVLVTEMTADEVRPLYDSQLEEAGWEQAATGGDVSATWSTWTFQDEAGNEWSGMLTLTQMPTVATEYFAMVRIEQLDDSP